MRKMLTASLGMMGEGFVEPLEGFAEPQAAQNLDSLSRIPYGNPTTNENRRFSDQAAQNLDSLPLATFGCSVEDPSGRGPERPSHPLGPLTRISKLRKGNPTTNE